MSHGGKLAQRYGEKLLKAYLKKCPTLFHLCYDPIGTHKKKRAVIGFLFGFLMGFLLHELIIVDLQFDRLTTLILGFSIMIMLSIGCATSIQVRCITLLTIPAFFGRSGRSVLKALIFGYVITGPIVNMTLNAKEVVRTFSCTSQLTYNLTKTRVNLMLEPFKYAIKNMKADSEELKDTLSSVKELTDPIVEEIEGEEEMKRLNEENDYLDNLQNETKRSEEIREKTLREQSRAKSEGEVYEAKYKAKIQARCEEQLSRGSEKCRDIFSDAYDKCYDTVSYLFGWLLCWPMKLTFVCNIVQALGGPKICDPEGKVGAGIGEGYVKLKATKKRLSENMKDVVLQYKIRKNQVLLDVNGPEDTMKAVMHEFSTRKKIFDKVITFIKRCLAFVFLKIILNAQEYHEKYLDDIEFDNIYISQYFRKIDARRKARESYTLLPLKKSERDIYVDPCELKQSKSEKKNLVGKVARLFLEMITVTAFVILDRLAFETLDLIRRNSQMEFTQIGHHDVKLEVQGTGIIAALIRSVVRGFNIKKRVNLVVTNEACLPQAKKLSGYVVFKIYGSYFGILLMLIGTAYTQRMRRVICSFFYRKREKRRILYLYNETLRRRRRYLRFMKSKVRALVRTRHLEQEIDIWLALRIKYPKVCNWLEIFACSREACLICEEREPRRGSKFLRCTTPGCAFIHCQECWRDVGEICLACAPQDDESDDYYEKVEPALK